MWPPAVVTAAAGGTSFKVVAYMLMVVGLLRDKIMEVVGTFGALFATKRTMQFVLQVFELDFWLIIDF